MQAIKKKDAVAIGAKKKRYAMKLINTIEISPLRYAKEEFELPEISDYPDPEEWYTKWEEVASRLNFNFKTIQKGSYLVDIEDIDDDNLELIVQARLKDIDFDDPEVLDHILALDGGIVLMMDDEIKIAPNCCSDIGNSDEWQRIFQKESSDWSDLWIGHPWIFYKKENGKIKFSDYSDENLQDFKDIKAIFEVDEYQLKTEFEKVMQQQINFKNRILEILRKMEINEAEKISELLAGIRN